MGSDESNDDTKAKQEERIQALKDKINQRAQEILDKHNVPRSDRP